MHPNGRTKRRQKRILLATIVTCILANFVLVAYPFVRHHYDVSHAQSLLRKRLTEQALLVLEGAATRCPDCGQLQFLIARCQRRMGRMDKVCAHLAKAAVRSFPKRELDREEWLALAQSGQMRDAQPHLSELLVNPGDDGAEICEAYVNGFFLTNQFDRAFELLAAWEAAFPQDSQPYLFRGRYQEGRANFSEAIAAYRQGLFRESGRHDFLLNLSRCLIALHEHEEASQILTHLQTEMPNDAEVHEVMGRCLLQRGETEKSRQVLNKLLNLFPKHATARLLMARCYQEERRYQDSLTLLEELAAERSFDIEVRYSFALTLQSTGDTHRAAKEFQFVTTAREAIAQARQMADTVIAKEPRNADLRYQIGAILLKYESPEAGAGWLRSALEFDPNHQLSHRALAEFYEQRGLVDFARSHREQQQASKTSGKDPHVPAAK